MKKGLHWSPINSSKQDFITNSILYLCLNKFNFRFCWYCITLWFIPSNLHDSNSNNYLRIKHHDKNEIIISGIFEFTVIDTISADIIIKTEERFNGRLKKGLVCSKSSSYNKLLFNFSKQHILKKIYFAYFGVLVLLCSKLNDQSI